MSGPCSVAGCETPAAKVRMCLKHYTRMRNHGTTDEPARRRVNIGPCAVEGCDLQSTENGYCKKHGTRARRHGDPLATKSNYRPAGPDHPGVREAVTYVNMHRRLARWLGKASEQVCACGQQAAHWAYDHSDPGELLDRGRPYSADPSHYLAMCVPCHKRMDLEHIKAAS